jgi:hypothetical protein
LKTVKNLFVGFLVSFLGSIPLGYLNVFGFEVYSKSGINSLLFYLLGVISIEVFVIYFTLVFANQLSNNKKLIRFIDLFSIFFMLFLAYIFHHSAHSESVISGNLSKYSSFSPYVTGIILSAFNFIQIPFWVAWNLYLINAKFLSLGNKRVVVYVIGTLIGTFFGMLTLVLGLNLVSANSETASKYMLLVVIPLFFLAMAVYQTVKYYKKYFNSKN